MYLLGGRNCTGNAANMVKSVEVYDMLRPGEPATVFSDAMCKGMYWKIFVTFRGTFVQRLNVLDLFCHVSF